MALPDPDVQVWAFCGGYLVTFDARDDDTNRFRVCLTREEVLAQVDSMLKDLDHNGAADAAERALKGK